MRILFRWFFTEVVSQCMLGPRAINEPPHTSSTIWLRWPSLLSGLQHVTSVQVRQEVKYRQRSLQEKHVFTFDTFLIWPESSWLRTDAHGQHLTSVWPQRAQSVHTEAGFIQTPPFLSFYPSTADKLINKERGQEVTDTQGSCVNENHCHNILWNKINK